MMKKIFFILVASLLMDRAIGQQNYCAQSKVKGMSSQRTLALPLGYVPPETKYDLKFYHLNLEVERNSLFVKGNVMSKAKVVVPSLDSFAFVLHTNHTIDSIYVNGAKQNFVRQDSLVKATVGTPILQDQLFDAIVYYKGTCPSGSTGAIGNGYNINTSPFWGNEVSWSLSESFVAYEWFPCKQDLTDKIDSSWVFATTDSANMVGSNGLLKNVTLLGNKKRYEWKSRYPIDYYLISVSTAKYRPYVLYAKPLYLLPDSILIQNFIYDNAITSTPWNTQKTELNKIVPTIELLSKLYGMYPFYKEKYGHCMAPLGGGMEHQTMTTQSFFDFELDAHELGHQWWGDNVTCKAWKDIFINEGWASYTEYLCDQYLPSISGMTASAKMLNVHSSVMSQPGGSAYFTNADTMNSAVIFDSRLTYDKGSAIIHSLRYVIHDDSVFFNAIRGFQNTYRGSTASVIEFRQYMESFTGLSFVQFFNQWYYGEGYPTFDVKWANTGNTFILKSVQTQSMPSSVPLFITPVDYRIARVSMPDTVVRFMHSQLTENYSIPLTGSVTSVVVDPDNWILNKVIGPVKDNTLLTSVQETESANAFVGPNPTSGALNIFIYQQQEATVEVTDLTGKIILSQRINRHAEFDMSRFSNGLYMVTIKNGKGETMKSVKVIKN